MDQPSIRVWDPLVRLFHWSLAASFAVAWLTADAWEDLHRWAGYAAAALIVFRLVWGLVGPRYARFRQFVRRPGATAAYLAAMLQGREPRHLGHNPAGAAMIVALLAVLGVTALTGWLYTTDAFWGAEWVEETHEAAASLMLLLVIGHIAGVTLASLRHRENLASAMLTGRKRAPSPADII
ncbi:cytochrome b/b6 domain-containing protein [Phenylobacterium sp.]|uniref:cytochrome b/b6 domain-containing protein n=1 Tax=Phenylobacterium sp. TaxID=1871053 RepID=UPI002CA3716E|nr:cytochrome b/b6 domain-containing protein [Phenylobacterium sp.]HVI31034.1 cytochrome b/b6 domain-containing protein [Phenylobacterium sp.]